MPYNLKKVAFLAGQNTILSCSILFLSFLLVALVTTKNSPFVSSYHDKFLLSTNIHQFYKINMDYQYEDRDVNTLLQLRAKEVSLDLEANIIIPALGDTTNQLEKVLKKEYLLYLDMVSKNKMIPHARNILITINLTQIHHWVGVIIRLDKFNQVLKVNYIDATNFNIPSSIKQSLQEVYGESLHIENTTAFFQTDNTGCGPLVVENLIEMVRGIAGSEDIVTKEKMLEIRKHHLTLAEKYDPNLRLNYRQKHNQRLLGVELNPIMYGGGLDASRYGSLNRLLLKRKVDERRKEIIRLRLYGQEPDDNTDRRTLSLLMEILIHDETYGKTETIEERRKTLSNIALVINLLSDTAKNEGEVERFKERYTENERSIWRDIIFLHKLVLPPEHPAHDRCYPITDSRVVKILEEDFALLKKIVRVELAGSLEENINLRKEFKDSYRFKNVYEIVNYYRELESLREIIQYTAPEFLNSIDITTPLGRFAVFRILEVIGENVSKKNLTKSTKDKTRIPIDWNLLVTVRNRLAHNEWSIMTDELPKIYSHLDLSDVVKDIPHIRKAILELLTNVEKIQNEPDYEQVMSDYYKPSIPFEETFWHITSELQVLILRNCNILVERKLITDAQFDQLKARVQQDIRKEKTSDEESVVDAIRRSIGEENFIRLGKEEKGLIGNISEKLTAELRSYKNKLSSITRQEEQKQKGLKLFYPGIREFSSRLSDDGQYQSMGGIKAQFTRDKLIELIIESINRLEKLIAQLPFGQDMLSMNQAFRESTAFFSCPGLECLPEYSFLSDVVKENFGIKHTDLVVPIISAPKVVGFDIDGDVFRKPTEVFGDFYKVISKYVAFNQQVLMDEMLNYAIFVSLSEQLKNDFVSFAALEYNIGTVYPYLKHLDPRSKNIIPESQQLELRCLRNVVEHGNIYIDLSNISPEQGIVRYVSLYIKTIKPELLKLQQFGSDYESYVHWLELLIQRLDERKDVSENELTKQASRYGFKCCDVPKDGNCFFHAVEAQLRRLNSMGQLTGILRNHQQLRALAIQHIEDHRRLYYDFVPEAEGLDNYLERMKVDGQYADGVIVLALTRALNVNLVIIPDNGAPPVIFRCPDSEAPTLYLGHQVGIQHYQELEPEELIGIDITAEQIDNWLPYDARPQTTIANNATIPFPSLTITGSPAITMLFNSPGTFSS